MLSQLGSPWLHLETCGSTSDEARKLAKAGKPHGTVVTADAQQHGRVGKAGCGIRRRGQSVPVVDLASAARAKNVPLLTLCAGLAVLEAAQSVLAEHGFCRRRCC